MIEIFGYLLFPIFGYSASAGWIGRIPILQGLSALLLVPLLWWSRWLFEVCKVSEASCPSHAWYVLVISSFLAAMVVGGGMALALRKHLVPNFLVYFVFAATIAAWGILLWWLQYYVWL
tara:strand:- start:338 stop:694 length:357 start_codon:yes stop_codon:yes gene_type:complete